MKRVMLFVMTFVVTLSLVPVTSAMAASTDIAQPTPTISGGDTPSEPPLPAPIQAPVDPPHVPVAYTVKEYRYKDPILGWQKAPESIDDILGKLSLTKDEIKFSNSTKDLDNLSIGDTLVVPPVHGVVYTILIGDTLSWIAQSFSVDVNSIISYNNIQNPDLLQPGQVIIVPGAKLPQLPRPVIPVYVAVTYTAPVSYTPAVPYTGGAVSNHFAFGFCTWYVANRRPVPWFGDAWAWWPNARAMGFAEGSVPRVGAIMVSSEAPVGHVSYVEKVNPDGSWVVSEMNYNAWDVIDTRTVLPGDRGLLVGFIY